MPQDDLFAGRGHAGHGRGHARQPLRHAGARRRARHGAARRLLRQGPQDRERDDHRLHRRGPVALRRGRRRGAAAARASRAPRRATPARWRRAINAMLASTLGPGKAQVKVNADLNVDETTRGGADRTPQGHAARRPPRRPRSSRAARPTHGRHRRHGLQRPDLLAAAAARSGNAQLQPQEERDRYGVHKKVTKTKIATGAVNKLDVALLVDKSVPPPVFDSLK